MNAGKKMSISGRMSVSFTNCKLRQCWVYITMKITVLQKVPYIECGKEAKKVIATLQDIGLRQ